MHSQLKSVILNMLRSYRDLTRFEFFLWLGSAAAVIGSFAVSWMISPEEGRDYLTLIGSLIGVTALIYVSKGYPLGQMLVVLWILATLTQVSYLPMAVRFLMFFVNDLYGFYNWRRLSREQGDGTES